MRAFARREGSQALRSSMIDRLRNAPKYAENVGLDISLPCAFTIFDIDDTAICDQHSEQMSTSPIWHDQDFAKPHQR